MTIEDKAKKFEAIQVGLWAMAVGGNPLQSIVAANMIREFNIEGPNGEDPESA